MASITTVEVSSWLGDLMSRALLGRRPRAPWPLSDLSCRLREWRFAAPAGGPLRETNWRRSVSWREAKATIGRPELRVHDLRHTAASVSLASGADPKVVQRVLGHATAAMTMDLYGHMIDRNLWDAAQRLGGTTGARTDEGPDDERWRLVGKSQLTRDNAQSRLSESNR